MGTNNGEGGTLKNGVITIGNKNFKYKTQIIKDSVVKYNYVSKNVQKIELNNITSGNERIMMGSILANITSAEDYSKDDNEITLTGLWVPEGETDAEGIEVSKTINITVDWYGSVTASLYTPYTSIEIDKLTSSDDKKIEFDFTLNDTKRQLLPKQNNIEVKIPQMFGNYPNSVECINQGVKSNYNEEEHVLTIERKTSLYNNTYTINLIYPEEVYSQLYSGYTISLPITAIFESYNNSNMVLENTEIDEQGQATTKSQKTKMQNITFRTQVPTKKEAYQFSVLLYDKSYVTTPTKGYAISKQNIMNAYNDAEPENMEYTVLWSVTRTEKVATEDVGIIMSDYRGDNSTKYGDSFNGNIVMSDYIKNTGICFTESNFIPQNGYIRVYDNDTNRLIKEFSYDEVKQYNSIANRYTYDEPVTHIRVETNEGNPDTNALLSIYNIKTADSSQIKESFTQEQMENMASLRTIFEGKLTNGSTVNGYDECKLTSEKSYASIELSETQMNTIDIEPIEQIITINVPSKNASLGNWQNGEFLVAIPTKAIAYMELNGAPSTSQNVQVSAYELIKESENYFIKIITNNSAPTSGYTISIRCQMLANPTFTGGEAEVELYYYNERCNIYHYSSQDKYDVNENEITTDEEVGLSRNEINILIPSSFMTFETISNYNEKGEIAIAPNIAEVERKINSENNGNGSSQESSQGNNQENIQDINQYSTGTAQININLINNYANSIENLIIIGKIPFEGNEINGTDLHSKFDTTMINGIEILNETQKNELNDVVKIYYSTKEEPDRYDNKTQEIEDYISDPVNGWIEADSVTDLSAVKSYLIIFENYKMNSGKSYTFSYKVKVPDDANLNDISYSSHMVSYEFITENGNLQPSSIIPNKVGLRVASYYDLEVMKYKANTELVVAGAKYKLTEISDENSITNTQNNQENNGDGSETENGNETQGEAENNTGNSQENIEEISRIITSTSEGKLSLSNLRVNQIYSFKEIQAPNSYELSGKNIIFKVTENLNKELEFVKLSTDDFDTTQTEIEKTTNGIYTLKSKVEDTPKFALNITKINSKNNDTIQGAIFEIAETNDISNMKKYVTDLNGNISLPNLNMNKSYTVKEKYVKGFYKLNDIEFTLSQDSEGNFSISSENEDFRDAEIVNDENNDLIQMNITLKNDEIPTYNLKIVKVSEKDGTTVLENARFSLRKIDLNNTEYFSTDENGEINITGLYQYVEEKAELITGRYTLKEIQAPTGYINNKEEITFSVSKKEDNKLEIQVENSENLQTLKEINIEENNVTIIIQDKPLFKITKVDSENGNPLKNTDFILYSLRDDGRIIDYAKNPNGEYIGRKNEQGQYIVKTDENGEIIESLGNGNYKAVEVGYPEGYEENHNEEVFTISGNKEKYQRTLYEPEMSLPTIEKYEDNTTKTYEISTIEDLIDFARAVNEGNSFSDTKVLLMNDLDFNDASSYRNSDPDKKYVDGNGNEIDLNGDEVIEGIQKELTTGKGFTPIGTAVNPGLNNAEYKAFSGIFDGGEHEIRNIYIHETTGYSSGLFGVVNNALIKDLGITGSINGGRYTGGICGNAINSIYFENCYNKCDISGYNEAGGILGKMILSNNYDTNITILSIDRCYNIGQINAIFPAYVGGLVGSISGSTAKSTEVSIKDSYNSGSITGDFYSGGICGYVIGKDIIVHNVTNSNIITGGDRSYYVAGIFGYCACNNVYISQANNSGEIMGDNSIGGIIGKLAATTAIIKDSKNTGVISTRETSGGFIGDNSGTLYMENCYNTGTIIDNYGTGNSSYELGGLIGKTSSPIEMEACYNEGNLDTTGYYVGGMIGSCTTNVGMESCYNTGNISGTYGIGGLIGTDSRGSSGTRKITMFNSYNTGNIVLLRGPVYGNGEIGGLIGDSKSQESLINYCTNSGNIYSYINNQAYMGGIAGTFMGDILNCSNTGSITAINPFNYYCIGGIVGMAGTKTIYNTANTGDINIVEFNSCYTESVGGISGAYGMITKAYNTGNISITSEVSNGSGSYYIGGIAGQNATSIVWTYNKGCIDLKYNGSR